MGPRLRRVGPRHKAGVTLVLGLLAVLAAPALAQTAPLADTQLSDPAQEAQAKALMGTIRCVECQGQSIADSNADIAANMRSLIRQRIKSGESPEQVRTWLIQRYGDYISYDPPLGGATWPLWAAPFVLLAIGIAIARSSFRRKR
ncbi:MAG: cytochrome c-type biogenesis protein CcmH [Sphingomonadales bacterium]|jgi:cytochrome c-type biogenesis protein CcmH|nr:cytochrome c-type biogenesis protein CcmH [Sphingomonadales bacterium]